ncbi:oligosaccharide flippase family protein [Brenneria populi subsp. brevivirga]|uniref:lipopolysaccharide biosynthesis protein n=1 Tax=Brenneria populi TaxID=1505588 RepID=UPI002E1880B3|nr:oligosaccharide flippase family protein [Brenneria populi subsp. brevivirga]
MKKIIMNTAWMVSEKSISIIGFFLVTAYVSKYLGPSMVGQLSYIFSIYQIVQAVAKWGGESVIFQRTSRNSDSGCRCLQASGTMRMGVLFLLAIPIEFFFYFTQDTTFFILSLAIAVSSLFNILDVYAIFYNAKLMSKYNTFTNCYGLIVNLSLRSLIVALACNPVWLALPIVINSGLPLFLRRRKYKTNHSVKLKKKYTTKNTFSTAVSI